MRKLLFGLVLVVPAFAVVTGCNKGGETSTTQSPGADPAATVPVAAIDLDTFEALDKVVADQKGKVVLVDFWATWCAPCVKKFPSHVARHKKYADKGLVCMSASLDPKPNGSYDKDAVLTFLKDKGATFPNYVLVGYRNYTESLGKRFGFEGGIPLLVLFDKTGKKVWDSEMKELSDAEVDKLVEAELAK